MDVSLMLSQTINRLSQSPVQTKLQAGEIAILGPDRIAETKGGREASREDVDRMMQTLQRAAGSVDERVSFEYNQKTKRLIMRLTDPNTNEVVRQIPSRDMIRILENIHDMVGMFIDEQR